MLSKVRSPSDSQRSVMQIIGLVIAIASVPISIYLSVRAERTKSLTLRYAVARSLMNVEPDTTPQLQISYDGLRVERPYLMSMRYQNTGNLPVEERDIERPLTLQFHSSAVLGVEITGRAPKDLSAILSHDSATVVIHHKLMNPGDWISFDLLLDGEPSLPDASIRVSGVSDLVELSASERTPRSYPTLLPLPSTATFVALALTSLVALVFLAIGLGAIGSEAKGMLFGKKQSAPVLAGIELMMEDDFPRYVGEWTIPTNKLTARAQELLEKAGVAFSLDLMDNSPELWNRLKCAFPDLTEEEQVEVFEEILDDLRRVAPTVVTAVLRDRIVGIADWGSDALERVQRLRYHNESLSRFLNRVRETIKDATKRPRGLEAVDSGIILLGIVLVFVGIAGTLVVGGTWRTLLAQ